MNAAWFIIFTRELMRRDMWYRLQPETRRHIATRRYIFGRGGRV